MKLFALLTTASVAAAALVVVGIIDNDIPQSIAISNVAAKGNKAAPRDQMDTIVWGNPRFMLNGKPFTPPVVADDDKTPPRKIEPFRFAPTQLKKQLTPHQRTEHGFAAFE